MPNWCKNLLKIEGDNLEVKRAIKMLKDDEGHLTFNKAVPMPIPLENTKAPSDRPNKHLIETYGADNWYDWRYKNWGVKWDASESQFFDDDDIIAEFETPWGPPIEFFKRLSLEFPELDFRLQFADEFFGGYPLGEVLFRNGEMSECEGPIEGGDKAEAMASEIWYGAWVDDWTKLEKLEDD